MSTMAKNSIFTNVALTEDGDVWWEGLTKEPPARLTDWRGNAWTPESKTPAAHPNARFTAPASQCPSIDASWEDPVGVPISAFMFGGRRATAVPLVYQAFNWNFGVYLGGHDRLGNHCRRRRRSRQGAPRPLRHAALLWLSHGRLFRPLAPDGTGESDPPRIFCVNWFRKDDNGQFVWPGFSENMRVLEWIVGRVRGRASGTESPIGWMPKYEDLRWTGLDFSRERFNTLMEVDREQWKSELLSHRELFEKLYDRLPQEFMWMREMILSALWRSPEHWRLEPETA